MARRPRSFYSGLSFRPPAPVAAAARRALERRAQQPPSNRGMTPVGLARARQLLNHHHRSNGELLRSPRSGQAGLNLGDLRQRPPGLGWLGRRPRPPLGRWPGSPDGCSRASTAALNQSTPPPLTRELINPATARSPDNTTGQTINTSKGEKLTRKKSRILLIIRVSKSAPCNSLEIPADRCRSSQTRGYSPCFRKRRRVPQKFFTSGEIPFPLHQHSSSPAAAPLRGAISGAAPGAMPPWVEAASPGR
jgi:hypothetical protein